MILDLHNGLSLAPLKSNILAIGILLVMTATSKGVKPSEFTLKIYFYVNHFPINHFIFHNIKEMKKNST